jgi:hypothetical protein
MKQDNKRISKEEYEVDYVRKLAREKIKEIKEMRTKLDSKNFNAKELRICRALLKFTK